MSFRPTSAAEGKNANLPRETSRRWSLFHRSKTGFSPPRLTNELPREDDRPRTPVDAPNLPPPTGRTASDSEASMKSLSRLNKLSIDGNSPAAVPDASRSTKRQVDDVTHDRSPPDRPAKLRGQTRIAPPRHESPPPNPNQVNMTPTQSAAEMEPKPSQSNVNYSTGQQAGYPNDPTRKERLVFEHITAQPIDDEPGGEETRMLLQPETRPITQDQLVNEVKGIYAGLVMVEKKCVEICQQQSKTTTKLSNEQWQALIALHRTLLHEHHDFFLASQHPTASPALRRLATKYAMPARMWRHGIHSFLELLRHRLPESLDHMLAFVYLAYSMMALLMESVPSFVETWIECLGDLARYRMAIEEADLRDREIWSNVARMWYNKAADRSPNVGRIQHHLAVLARPNIVQQLFYYSKALVSVVPFSNARESVMLLFSPFLEKAELTYQRYPVVESALVTALGIMFTKGSISDFSIQSQKFTTGLDDHIIRTGSKWKSQGPEVASSLIAGLLDFGSEGSFLWKSFLDHAELVKSRRQNPDSTDQAQLEVEDAQTRDLIHEDYWKTHGETASDFPRALGPDHAKGMTNFGSSIDILAHTLPVFRESTMTVSKRIGDKNILPFMSFILSFLWSLSFIPKALIHIEAWVPWSQIVIFLNTLGHSGLSYERIESATFPQPLSGTGRQLPEDFPMRGLVWAPFVLPVGFFQFHVTDEDERTLELPSHGLPRAERVLWLGTRLASLNRYFTYNVSSQQFTVTDFAASLEPSSIHTLVSHSRTMAVQKDGDTEMADAT